MSGNVTNPFNQTKTALYFGQQVNIVDTAENNSVVIQFEDGSRKVVSRAELLSTPLFAWNQERIEENNQRIEEYKALAQEAELEKKSLWKEIRIVKEQINNKFHEWGTRFLHNMNSEQKEEYITMRDETRSLQGKATAWGNKSLSYSLSAFMVACDNRHYV